MLQLEQKKDNVTTDDPAQFYSKTLLATHR